MCKEAIWALLTHLLSRGGPILAAMIVAKLASSLEFAMFAYFQLTAAMIANYATLWMTAPIIKATAQYISGFRGASEQIARITRVGLIAPATAAAIAYLTAFLWIDADIRFPTHMLPLGILAMSLGNLSASAAVGARTYKQSALAAIASFTILSVFLYVSIVKGDIILGIYGVITAAAAQALMTMIGVLSKCRAAKIGRSASDLKEREPSQVGSIWPQAVISVLSSSAIWLVGRIILRADDGVVQYARFSAGLQWFALIMIIPAVASRLFTPRLSVERSTKALQSYAHRSLVFAICPAAVLALILFLASGTINSLYSGKYELSGVYFLLILVAGVMSAGGQALGDVLTFSGNQLSWMRVYVVWFVVLMAGLAIGASKWENSPVLSMAIAYGAMVVLGGVSAWRKNLI